MIVLGDIIAILRHAKAAQGKITMQKVTAATGTSQDSSLAKKVTSTASAASSKERVSLIFALSLGSHDRQRSKNFAQQA